MKVLTTIVLLLTLAISLPVLGNGIEFHQKNWDWALKQAQKDNKPIFVQTFASYCLPCKVMQRAVFTDEDLAEYFNENFINYKVDMDGVDGGTFGVAYGVQTLPTLLFFSPDGQVIENTVGFKTKEELLAWGKYVMGESEDPEFILAQKESKPIASESLTAAKEKRSASRHIQKKAPEPSPIEAITAAQKRLREQDAAAREAMSPDDILKAQEEEQARLKVELVKQKEREEALLAQAAAAEQMKKKAEKEARKKEKAEQEAALQAQAEAEDEVVEVEEVIEEVVEVEEVVEEAVEVEEIVEVDEVVEEVVETETTTATQEETIALPNVAPQMLLNVLIDMENLDVDYLNFTKYEQGFTHYNRHEEVAEIMSREAWQTSSNFKTIFESVETLESPAIAFILENKAAFVDFFSEKVIRDLLYLAGEYTLPKAINLKDDALYERTMTILDEFEYTDEWLIRVQWAVNYFSGIANWSEVATVVQDNQFFFSNTCLSDMGWLLLENNADKNSLQKAIQFNEVRKSESVQSLIVLSHLNEKIGENTEAANYAQSALESTNLSPDVAKKLNDLLERVGIK